MSEKEELAPPSSSLRTIILQLPDGQVQVDVMQLMREMGAIKDMAPRKSDDVIGSDDDLSHMEDEDEPAAPDAFDDGDSMLPEAERLGKCGKRTMLERLQRMMGRVMSISSMGDATARGSSDEDDVAGTAGEGRDYYAPMDDFFDDSELVRNIEEQHRLTSRIKRAPASSRFYVERGDGSAIDLDGFASSDGEGGSVRGGSSQSRLGHGSHGGSSDEQSVGGGGDGESKLEQLRSTSQRRFVNKFVKKAWTDDGEAAALLEALRVAAQDVRTQPSDRPLSEAHHVVKNYLPRELDAQLLALDSRVAELKLDAECQLAYLARVCAISGLGSRNAERWIKLVNAEDKMHAARNSMALAQERIAAEVEALLRTAADEKVVSNEAILEALMQFAEDVKNCSAAVRAYRKALPPSERKSVTLPLTRDEALKELVPLWQGRVTVNRLRGLIKTRQRKLRKAVAAAGVLPKPVLPPLLPEADGGAALAASGVVAMDVEQLDEEEEEDEDEDEEEEESKAESIESDFSSSQLSADYVEAVPRDPIMGSSFPSLPEYSFEAFEPKIGM